MDPASPYEGVRIHGVDMFIVVAYLLAIPCFGFYFKRYVKTGKDYFLAGRMLPWWVISFSIIGSNIGATDYVGAAGGAYRFGLAQANFEWIGAIPAIVLSAMLFVPYYWRAGVYTVPEFLGLRYNGAVRIIQTILWCYFMVFSMGLYFWASGLMLEGYLGIPITLEEYRGIPLCIDVFGVTLKPILPAIILTALIVGVYTVVGGLAAVAMTDVVQLLVMFVGGIALTVLGVSAVGGWAAMAEQVTATHPHHLQLFLPANHHMYPWPAVILGLAFVASPAWWCCNQAMVQRCLGARSQWDAKAGMMFAALPKMMIPLITTIPGLIALVLLPSITPEEGDKVYPLLIKTLLPAGLSGLVIAAFMAALISSVDSTLNSISTLLTKDLYQRYLVRNASDRHYLTVGRVLTAVFVGVAIFIAPVTKRFEGIFVAGGTMLAIFQGPTFAIALLGIYWRRATQWGGLIGMLGGLAISTGLFGTYWVMDEKIAFFYVAWWSFVGSLFITVLVSLMTKPEPTEKLEGLVYGLVMRDQHLQDRLAKRAEGEQ